MDAVVLSAVWKWVGGVGVITGLDLRVGWGESVALVGANGCGKSTTLELVLGLVQPDKGSVFVCGMEPEAACAQGRVGAMLQSGGLVGGLSVRELVELVRRLSGGPCVERTLARAAVESIADRRIEQLSGGEVQRVRFALAIAGGPEVLVLDEPTAGMDEAARRGFWAEMDGWVDGGGALVFATHDRSEARAHGTRLLSLSDRDVGARHRERGRVIDGTSRGASP